MSLVEFAKMELELIGGGKEEEQQMINKDILEIVETFAKQGHSGFSASYALNIIKRLLDFKPIKPLTGENDEWSDVPPWDNGNKTQQNKRCSAVFRDNFDNSTAHYIDGKVFSDNGGKTWFHKGGRGEGSSAVPVVFPFKVPEKPEYIILPQDAESTEQHGEAEQGGEHR